MLVPDEKVEDIIIEENRVPVDPKVNVLKIENSVKHMSQTSELASAVYQQDFAVGG